MLAPFSQSILSKGSSYGAHWCSQLLFQSITYDGWPVHGRKCGVHFTMQFGADRHPGGEPQVESACSSASRAGDASVAGAGQYSHTLGKVATTMQETGEARSRVSLRSSIIRVQGHHESNG
jgi:hypothetical protein